MNTIKKMPDDIKQFILERIQVEDSSLVVEMIMDSEELDRLCNGRYIVNKDRLARMISRKEKANDIFQMCFKNTPIQIIIEMPQKRIDLLNYHEITNEDLRNAFKRAFKHFSEHMNNSNLQKFTEYDAEGECSELFREIIAADKYGGANGGDKPIPLLPDTMKYGLLPDDMRIRAMTNERAFFFNQNDYQVEVKVFPEEDCCFVGHHFLDEDYDEFEKEKWQTDQEIRGDRFIKFLHYFRYSDNDRKQYPIYKDGDFDRAQEAVQSKFIGINGLFEELRTKMKLFSSKLHKQPKGLIFYGPPGTGKSAISIELIKELGLFFITYPLAAGDIKKGIVGDSERTLNAIADRARLICWDSCVVFIDEIDSLVPERKNQENHQSGNNDLIGVFLSLMDGAKIVKNLKVFATTNLLMAIDEAMRRRIEIQVFLGNPSREQREQWRDFKISVIDQHYANNQRDKFYINFKNATNNQTIRRMLVNSSLNFSADALRKLIDGFFEHLLTEDHSTFEQWEALLKKKVKDVSIESNVAFGSVFVIDILLQESKLVMHLDQPSYQKLLNIPQTENTITHRRTQLKHAKRMLITPNMDLSTDEFIRIETHESIIWTTAYDHMYQRLLHALGPQPNINFKFLLCLFLQFPEVTYSERMLEVIRLNIINSRNTEVFAKNFNFNAKQYLLDEHINDLQGYDEIFSVLSKDINNLIKTFNTSQGLSITPMSLAAQFLIELNKLRRQNYIIQSFRIFQHSSILERGWKYITLKFAEQFNADMVVLIDSYYLQMNKASDDKEVQSHITKVINDMKLYSKCVIIFDLDSIAFIKEQYSGLKEPLKAPSLMGLQSFNNQAQFSYEVQRQGALNTCLDLIYNADPDGNIWYIAKIGNNKLILDYETKMQWKQSEIAKKYEEEEAKKDVEYKCLTCKEIFTIRENESQELKCKVHDILDKFVFEDKDNKEVVSQAQFTRLTQQAQGRKLTTMFKYLCCNQTYGSKGCRSTHHSLNNSIQYSDQMQRADHEQNRVMQ